MTWRIIGGLLIKTLGTLAELALPAILSYMIDDIVPTGNKKTIWLFGSIMVLCSVLAWGWNILANRNAAGVSRDTTEQLRTNLFTRISYLSAKQVDTFTIPSLESRLTSDTYNVHQMLNMTQRMGVRAPIMLIGGIAITLMLEPVLTLTMVVILPLITVVVAVITKKGVPLYTDLQEAIDRMTRIVRENAQGIRVIKALTKEDHERKRFDSANTDLTAQERKTSLTMAITNPCVNVLMNLGLVAVIIVGAYRVNGGYTKPGMILSFMSYFTQISVAMLSITRIFIMITRGVASANRIAEILDTPTDMEVLPETPESNTGDSDTEISFEHVRFSYNGRKNDLDDISFTLKKGGTLGIIGPTGSGKTTIISLLMRQYDPQSGVIRIAGRDVRTIPREELSLKFGGAFQNDFLFADTIAENIEFGRTLTQEEVKAAAEIAQAIPFIEEKEDGYNHVLSIMGSNLSGGQKQRTLIARALASTPEILILDDSSSALDYATDAALRTAIRKKTENNTNMTSVIIAQRVSSIAHADLILVIEDGKISGMGRHEDLLASCPLYKEIADSQMGGAILE